MTAPVDDSATPTHWLRRPGTVRKLWWVLYAVLAASVAAEIGVSHHAVVGIDGTFGFHAWYGFLACVAMVLGAKLLGLAVKRRDDHYETDAGAEGGRREPGPP